MTSARALVVSLHDVSPYTFAESRRAITELRSLGVTRISLLVVPDHHHHGRIAADAEFCEWLTAQQAEGHEIVLHGYFHQRKRRAGETLRQRLATRVYTADEGEFFDVNQSTADELVTRGLADFRAVGLEPSGFIAPAWLLSAPAESALRDLGIEYTTRLRTVTDLRRDCSTSSQSLVWSVRSGWRRAVSLRWNAMLFRRLRALPLLRISIHPVDLAHAAIWRQIRVLAARAIKDRTPMTYRAWIDQQRAACSTALNSQST